MAATTLTKARTLAKSDLARLVQLTKSSGVKLVDWHVLGQPAPESVLGSVLVSSARAGSFVSALLKVRGLRPRVEVFPLGIPVPRQFSVRFRI